MDGYHTYNFILFIGQGNAPHPGGCTAHWPGFALFEADGLPGTEAKENLAGTGGEFGVDKFIAFADADGYDPVLPRPGILFQRGFLYGPFLGRHNHVMAVYIFLILQVLGTDKGF